MAVLSTGVAGGESARLFAHEALSYCSGSLVEGVSNEMHEFRT